jgi:class 3 adenylate cyclase
VAARERADAATHAYYETHSGLHSQAGVPYYGYDTGAADELPVLTAKARDARHHAATADTDVDSLTGDPLLAAQPDPAGVLDAARTTWISERQRAMSATALRAAQHADLEARSLHSREHSMPTRQPEHHERGISR